jgi:NADH-quinone oxidoreductase subunit H
MSYIFSFLIFPGFIFSSIIGLLSSWIDRKVTARIQWRVGPPLMQPFYDFLKLLGKEVIIPEGAETFGFLIGPIIGLSGAALAAAIIGEANIRESYFIGDLIVVIYLLILPAIALIIGASASGNPLSAVGASREMKLILGYELPLALAASVVIIRTGGSLSLGDMADQVAIASISGFIAFIVALMSVQAKLGFVPFDIAEAETEIMTGTYAEYSGAPLATFHLTNAILLFALPSLLVTLFLGGFHFSGLGILWGILKYVLVLTLIILIKNTNPRLRIDQAMRFFWRYMAPLAAVGLVLAIIGQIYGISWL